MGTAIGLQKRNREEKEDPKSILVDVCQERHSLLLLLLTPQRILSSKTKVLVIFNIGTQWTVSKIVPDKNPSQLVRADSESKIYVQIEVKIV